MLKNMNYIYEVYKENSFSRAARNLFVSQSSLSQTIKHAEERIGMEIFDRSTHPISLTAFGELYIKAVEEIRVIINNLESYIDDVNQMKSGRLSIGAGNFFAAHLVPPVITLFKNAHPNIKIDLIEGRTVDMIDDLNKGNIDLLISNGQLDTALYEKTPLFQEHMVLSVPRRFFLKPPHQESLLTPKALSHPRLLINTPAVPLKTFSKIPFILLRPGNDARRRADQMFSTDHIKPIILLETDQTSTAFAMSRSGMGATIIDDALVCAVGDFSGIWLYKLHSAYAVRDVAIYTKKNTYVTRAMKEFIQLIQQIKKIPFTDTKTF